MHTTLAQTRKACEVMLEALKRGETPNIKPQALPLFADSTLEPYAHIDSSILPTFLASLDARDIPTLERALAAIENREQAWLGFKLVYDPEVAITSEDTEVVGMTGQGSADGLCALYFVSEAKELVTGRPYSARDKFQAEDITRGPGMHSEQYAGLDWLALPLFADGRVFIMGAGNVSMFMEEFAQACDFDTIVVDYDPDYLNEERFPLSQRVMTDEFKNLDEVLDVTEDDFICVVTRGHMHDPEAMAFGIETEAQYIGMMGCAEKNARVMEIMAARGANLDDLEGRVYAPIGLKFGAKTAPELAMCIVAQLIEIRHNRRK